MEIIVIVFLVLFAIVTLTVSLGLKILESQRQQQVRDVLRKVDADSTGSARKVVIRKQEKEDRVQGALESLGVFQGLQAKLQQSGLGWTLAPFLFLSFVLTILGGAIGYNLPVFVFPVLSMLVLGLVLGMLPYLYVLHKRKTRMEEFEQQFPEALEFLARSMRAGHAFSVSMGMTGEDTPDPLGSEFRQTYNEQNLGATVDEAMRSLSVRVPLIDVRFFVAAVLMQREVGGNLAEILDNLAHVIRERFRIKGHVKAVSAHGRLTATVLVILPILLFVAMMFVAPSYLRSLAEDEHGKYLIVYAIVAQLVGFYFIRRIVRIKI